ncbi:bifunctional 5,10-methylenetetrahydrofolate dehydrogenase/5,10-methenyltetrahydrofolate cyclohydrolase [Candidatus Daviesbacteria bacterium]|nr:bifunctional 5,10-methylenetetrahydrofolate dehydrogenase/5,10-methenyltetrahydrofolate cyclohydrolase [Candidatus Daviesbacteria bacterium]
MDEQSSSLNKIIDGKTLALEHEEKLRQTLAQFKNGRLPKLVSFVNKNDEPSVKYTNMKSKKAEALGIQFITRKISPGTKYSLITREIKKYNVDPSIDGIMVQLPIPESVLDGKLPKELLDKILPEKDVDGLTERSQYLPATVKGVMTILESEGVLGKGKVIRVLGGVHGMVGSSLVKALHGMHEKVIGVSKSDPAIKTLARWADILISAVGQPNLVTEDMVKPGAVVVDVGKDVDTENVMKKVSRITPKIGGVGPMTVISLMENVTEAFCRSHPERS